MDFITQLFTDLGTTDSLMILLFLTGAAFIGWLIGRWSLSGKVKDLTNKLAQRDRDVITLENNLATLQKQMEEREDEIVKLRIQVTEWEATAEKLEREKANSNVELQNANHEILALRQQQDVYEEEIDGLKNQILGLKAKTNQLHSEIERDENLYDDLTVLQTAFNESQSRIEKLESRLESLETNPLVVPTASTATSEAGTHTIPSTSNDPELDKVETYETETEAPSSSETVEMLSTEDRAAQARMKLREAIGSRIPPADKEVKDDLKKIEGIGPFIEEKLNSIGLYTFEQISRLDDELITEVTSAIQFFPGRIKRDDWVGQASKIMHVG